jgi:hypothetical protein
VGIVEIGPDVAPMLKVRRCVPDHSGSNLPLIGFPALARASFSRLVS